MPQFVITHHGVPIGTVGLDPTADVATGAVEPTPGFEAVRPLARAAGEALKASGFFGSRPDASQSDPAAGELTTEALQRGAELGRALELRDETGALVPTTFIELAAWPGTAPEVVAWVSFRAAPASVPASEPPRQGTGSGAAPPEP